MADLANPQQLSLYAHVGIDDEVGMQAEMIEEQVDIEGVVAYHWRKYLKCGD